MVGAQTTVPERVVEEVARATGRDERRLPPLYEAVDTDALDTLVGESRNVEISFDYAGYEVTVESEGGITLEERSGAHPTSGVPTAD